MNKLQFIGCDASYEESNVVLLGAPFDGTVSFRPGTRFAPNAIRLDSIGIETYSPYQDNDIEAMLVHDKGDIDIAFGNTVKVLETLKQEITNIVQDKKIPLLIGGEHLVSLPAIEAVHEQYPDLHVIHFDAHTDLRDDYEGEALSHATVMKQVATKLGNNKLFQFGIRSGLKEEFEYAETHQYIEKYTVNTVKTIASSLQHKPVYITLDLDVLDPSLMKGTGTPEAGGVSFNELLDAIIACKGLHIVGIDIVELAPHYDPSGVSTMVAVKLIRELLLLLSKEM